MAASAVKMEIIKKTHPFWLDCTTRGRTGQEHMKKAPAGSRGRKGDEEVAAEEICLIMSTTAILVSSIGSFLFTKGFIKRKARMRKIGVFVEVIAVIVALLNALWYLILLAWRASQ